jgi:2-aminoadipate transaminase
MLSLARRKRVLEIAAKYQTLIVEDDPYGDLYFKDATPPSLLALSTQVAGSREWLAHCGSLSKALSPGLRVGWMVAPPDLLMKAVKCKQFSDAHTSTFAQATAAQYLASGRMKSALDRVRSTYASRATLMCNELTAKLGDAVSFNAPHGGMFVWSRLSGANGKANNADDFAAPSTKASPLFPARRSSQTIRTVQRFV